MQGRTIITTLAQLASKNKPAIPEDQGQSLQMNHLAFV
jgi:hypothetical protein